MKLRTISVISASWLAALTASTLTLVSQAQASETGRPSEILDRKCTDLPVVTVCAMNQAGKNLPQLEIVYRGYLNGSDYKGVVTWISLNGKTGFFHMQSETANGASKLWIGAPKSEYQCVVGGNLAPASNSLNTAALDVPKCPPGTAGQPGELRWLFEPPAEEEAALFEGLQPEDREYPPWKIELAFVSVDGRRWDSRYGANYQFLFKSPTNP